MSHATWKYLRKSSPWGQPASTSVKLNAVTNASNYPPLLIAIKGLFVSMLVLTKLICFSECWSADLLVFLSVLEQEISRHRSAQRKVKWHFFCEYKFMTQNWQPGEAAMRIAESLVTALIRSEYNIISTIPSMPDLAETTWRLNQRTTHEISQLNVLWMESNVL